MKFYEIKILAKDEHEGDLQYSNEKEVADEIIDSISRDMGLRIIGIKAKEISEERLNQLCLEFVEGVRK